MTFVTAKLTPPPKTVQISTPHTAATGVLKGQLSFSTTALDSEHIVGDKARHAIALSMDQSELFKTLLTLIEEGRNTERAQCNQGKVSLVYWN